MRPCRVVLPLLALLALAPPARADEGMWTLNGFPKDALKAKHGVAVDDKWLEHVRLSSVRLAGGCSGSFVSADGLVMTNHHCAHSCIEQVSTKERDLVKQGFTARTPADEIRCPEIEINQLVEITDVTEKLRQATRGLADKKFNVKLKAEMSRLEKQCQTSPALRCEVVTLYHGGAYHLYRYQRYQDTRLVFAPEFSIAFFGGDPDNFMFPRYDLDMAFLRVYAGGKPLKTPHHFAWSKAGAKDGDVTFVTGHPGGSSRQLTIAQLEYQRDLGLPDRIIRLSEYRGLLTEFARRSPEHKRISNEELFSVENGIKALAGRLDALQQKRFFQSKVAEERALRDGIDRDPALRRQHAGAFDAIARAQERLRELRRPYGLLERGSGFYSMLFDHARALVRAAAERPKPNEQRLREYNEARLPALTQELFSKAPIHDDLEILRLSFALGKLREQLGADHPVVRKVLGKESPEEMAARLVKGTTLKDPAVRKQLWDGGKRAVDASTDPFIKLAKLVDADARAVRKTYEDQVEAPVKHNAELLAKARFAVRGTGTYPDATFTLRITFGRVRGYTENGRVIKPFTDLAGAFARDTGRAPFDLPPSWHRAKAKLDLKTPFNFCSDNDIIGGNSGSPVINRKAEVVGLVFDGNLQSLGGEYGFDAATNRAVAVHSAAIIHALERIYGAERLAQELRGK